MNNVSVIGLPRRQRHDHKLVSLLSFNESDYSTLELLYICVLILTRGCL